MTNNDDRTLSVSADPDSEEELFVTLTPEILAALDLKVGDSVAWVQNDDNTFTLRKATHEEISQKEGSTTTQM